jgi:hypothetical protein
MTPQEPAAFAALEWPGDVRDLDGGAAAVWPWLLLALAIALGCTFAARRRRAVATPAGELAAAATALARLQALAVPASGAAPAAVVAFCAELKALLRLHGRERFGFAAEAATSEEIVARVPTTAELRACLATCDRVLFAAASPAVDERTASRAAAIAFVMATSPAAAAVPGADA